MADQGTDTLWGGRFHEAPAEKVRRFTESVSFDARLALHDIRGSMAHASMLGAVGLLTQQELSEIRDGLGQISNDIRAGAFKWRPELEDVHMNIEAALTEITPAGAKLHTARSRNDQVATTVRLWLKDEILAQQNATRRLQEALVKAADREPAALLPGYTHLQRAQPVLLAHHLLAYVEMLERDHARLNDALGRTNCCPLGAGAIAGSTLPIDREATARTLGFVDSRGHPCVIGNSMDAVSDRDFIVEFLAAGALCAVHLSRLAEDIILWCTSEFNFVELADAHTTGSSLMPQKKNPDVPELVRGKTGRVTGNLVSLLVTLKGLPMTYNRDLQEDKQRLFDTADTLRDCLGLMADVIDGAKFHLKNMRRAASDPSLLATDVADELVRRGVPFREAHRLVGTAVRIARDSGRDIGELEHDEWMAISPLLEDAAGLVRSGPRRRLAARSPEGSPNPRLVRKEITRWRHFLEDAAGRRQSVQDGGDV